MKKAFFLFAIILTLAFSIRQTNAASQPKDDAYKAIVKIKSFALNADYQLTGFSSGSGVIIDPSGIVLTNYHVVNLKDDFDNTERDASYIICLTESISQEPNCGFIGKFIASDKDLDLALLQINNIEGYGNKSVFPYLDLNAADATQVSDEVTALGYPSIGGGTITITSGVISGKTSKYNKDWIKTDAIISYGSSGGAAIDADGKVIGITSRAHSDLLGSLGYIINITSINDWVSDSKGLNAAVNPITNRTIDLAKKIINLKNGNSFANASPSYLITKPSDWKFSYKDETILFIDNESDDDGGGILINTIKFPYVVDTSIVESNIKRSLDSSNIISLATIIKNEDTEINGRKAKKVMLSSFGSQTNYYYIPVNNYLVEVYYNYGKNDKDKSIIDGMIKSLSINGSDWYIEKTEYSNNNPKFNINAGDGWAFLPKNSKTAPLFLTQKDAKNAFADIQVEKTDDNTKNLNNEEYLNSKLQEVKEFNNTGNIYDIKMEVLESDAHYKLNNELGDIVMMDYIKKSVSSGEVLSQNRIYFIKAGDKYILPSLNYFSDNESGYNDIAVKFNKMLSSLSVIIPPSSNLTNTVQPVIEYPVAVKNSAMYKKLKGKIMLKVEDNGKAYYVHPSSEKMYYLGRPDDAFAVMREQGVGITNSNLEKIPVGLGDLTGSDTDGDGLPDLLEDAIGTNKNNTDSDGDGYNDKAELEGGYNPNGSGKLNTDNNFSSGQKGKIFLQIEKNGEAWYVNPNDGKRYFLGRPADAFNVMRNLGLGISNSDFDSMR